MADTPKFQISEDLMLKVEAESKDTHRHRVGSSEFIHFHMSETPTRSGLEILLKAQKDVIDQAWDLFHKTEDVKQSLDIVGSALYTLNLTYETNMRTLRQWHANLHGCDDHDLSNDEVGKKMDDINATMSQILGRPVDIAGMSEEDMDRLLDEAMAKGLASDLSNLNDRLWGKEQ